jgi:iron(III) transport system ATP-binding protein
VSAALVLESVCVAYGDVCAVDTVSLSLQAGSIGCLLGPSGCGKTSLLRAIAGFERPRSGTIHLHGELISGPGLHQPPERRRVGMVFQDFALFPQHTVAGNVGFGLRRQPAPERAARVAQMLELVGLSGYAGAMPHELSGGQQQRVALARALAPRPRILLLDEPFSGLDAELREDLAAEVRMLLKRDGTTAILVTHDQQEAFTLADDITLMRSGRIAQRGSAAELYAHPRDRFVAAFIGRGSVLSLTVGDDRSLTPALGTSAPGSWPAGRLEVVIRPEQVRCGLEGCGGDLTLPVLSRSYHGNHFRYRVRLADGQQLECEAPPELLLEPGELLSVSVDLERAEPLPSQ